MAGLFGGGGGQKGIWKSGYQVVGIRGPGNQVLGAFGRSAAVDSMKVVLEIGKETS